MKHPGSKTLLLANSEAHGGRAAKLIPRLCDFLSGRISGFEYQPTDSREGLRAAAREAASEGFERVLVAGGDGTAHQVVNALTRTDTALGVIPLGNGNDIADSLGLPRDPFAAAEHLLAAPVRMMDVVRAGEEIFAGVAGTGFDAAANRLADRMPGWPRGHLRYWVAAFTTAATYEAEWMELVADGERIEGRFQWAAFANTPFYGGGVCIAPRADWSDGFMDICLVSPRGFWELLDVYPAFFHGRHERLPGVRMLRAREVEIRAPLRSEVYGDGELLGGTPMRLRVEPGALRVLTGRG